MAILTDTNVLLRSLYPEHLHYFAAENALAALRLRGEALCVAPQNLMEFWAVATRSREDNGLGMSPCQGGKRNRNLAAILSLAPTHSGGVGRMAENRYDPGSYRKADSRRPSGRSYAGVFGIELF